MKKMMILLLTTLFLSAASMNAQVTIGSGNPPTPGTVLDLSQSATPLGLRLPVVSLDKDSTLQLTGGNRDSVGIVVYNDGKGALPAGLYVWGGKLWSEVTSTGGANNGNYKTLLIGNTWWTVENLEYGSVKGEDAAADFYATDYNEGADDTHSSYTAGTIRRGYYYTLEQAVKACASLGAGWQLPTKDDWEDLVSEYLKLRQRQQRELLETAYAGHRLADDKWYSWNTVGAYWYANPEIPDRIFRFGGGYGWYTYTNDRYGFAKETTVRCVKK